MSVFKGTRGEYVPSGFKKYRKEAKRLHDKLNMAIDQVIAAMERGEDPGELSF